MYPGGFGIAKEDINCRCAAVQRGKWHLDAPETKYLGNTDDMTDEQLEPLANKLHISVKELRKYKGNIIPVRAESYEDFRRQYEEIWNHEDIKVR